ncbi:hypothetical protein ACFQ1S_46735, partial [Kibdelosporangium lantanae]
YFGTREFFPCEVWAHQSFRVDPGDQAVWAGKYRDTGEEDVALAGQVNVSKATPTLVKGVLR